MTAKHDESLDLPTAPRLDPYARAALAMAGTPDRRRTTMADGTLVPADSARSGESYATNLLREHREAVASMVIVVSTRRPER